jgi:hypothetical protein
VKLRRDLEINIEQTYDYCETFENISTVLPRNKSVIRNQAKIMWSEQLALCSQFRSDLETYDLFKFISS